MPVRHVLQKVDQYAFAMTMLELVTCRVSADRTHRSRRAGHNVTPAHATLDTRRVSKRVRVRVRRGLASSWLSVRGDHEFELDEGGEEGAAGMHCCRETDQ